MIGPSPRPRVGAVRHLPGRSVPALGRLRRGQAARAMPAATSTCPRRRPAAASRPTTPATRPPRRPRAPDHRRLRGASTTSSRRPARAPACSSCTIPSCWPAIPPGRTARTRVRAPRCTSSSPSWSTCAASTGVDAALAAPRHLSRQLLGPARARHQGAAAQAAALASRGSSSSRWPTAEVCCGFGGTFSVKYPDISNAIVERKADQHRGDRADLLLAGDLGCLMNMAGKLSPPGPQDRRAPRGRGAGRRAAPIRRSASAERHERDARYAGLQGQRTRRRSPTRSCSARLPERADRPGRAAAAPRARGLPEFEALRDIGRDIKDHTLAHLDLYLEEFERKASAAGAEVHCAADGRGRPPDRARDLPRRRRPHRHQGQVDDLRGDRASTPRLEAAGIEVAETDLGEYLIQIRGETPSHIIAPAIHLTQDQVEADFRRLHTNLPEDRAADRAGPARRRGARRSCARSSSPPTSASPAPTS